MCDRTTTVLWCHEDFEPKKPRARRTPRGGVVTPVAPKSRSLTREEQAVVLRAHKALPSILRSMRGMAASCGQEGPDLHQAILCTFSKRLVGEHPWDPTRIPLESYLHMLVLGVMRNEHKKKLRRIRRWNAVATAMKDRHSKVEESVLDPEEGIMGFLRPRKTFTVTEAWEAMR